MGLAFVGWGFVRWHNAGVQKEINDSIKRTEDPVYRAILAQHYTLYSANIPFSKKSGQKNEKSGT